MAVLILAICICSLPVSAASPAISVSSSAGQVSPGQTFTVSVSLSANSNLASLNLNVTYDTSEFELVSGSATAVGVFNDAVVSESNGNVKYSASTASSVTKGGTLLSFQLKALKYGGKIRASVSSATDGSSLDGNTPISVSGSSITLTCAHQYEWKVTTPATCTAEGVETGTCKCGDTKTRKIDKAAHKYKNPEIITAPTCTKEGLARGDCDVCGAKGSEQKIPASGHSWSEWVVTKEPSVISVGEQQRTCKVCQKTETKMMSATDNEPTTPDTESSSIDSFFPTQPSTEYNTLPTTTRPTQNYYEIETEPQTEPSGGLFGNTNLSDSDVATLLVIVLAILVVVVLTVYILLLFQRRKKK